MLVFYVSPQFKHALAQFSDLRFRRPRKIGPTFERIFRIDDGRVVRVLQLHFGRRLLFNNRVPILRALVAGQRVRVDERFPLVYVVQRVQANRGFGIDALTLVKMLLCKIDHPLLQKIHGARNKHSSKVLTFWKSPPPLPAGPDQRKIIKESDEIIMRSV